MLPRMMQITTTRPGVVAPVPVDPTGRAGPTPGQARGRRYRRVASNLYVDADTDSDALDQRVVEALATAPPGSAVTGWAALYWLGGRWFNGIAVDGCTPLSVPIAVGDRQAPRPREGVTYSGDWLFPDDIMRHEGLPITVPLRSVTYEARRARHELPAAQVINLAMASDLVSIDEVKAYVDRLAFRGGVVLLRDTLPWLDENVWSPQEDKMRYLWAIHLSRPLLTNTPIFDLAGRHLFTPDLFDPEAGVAGEYDGAHHLRDSQRGVDLDRTEAYRRHRIEAATMMSTAHDSEARFIERLHGAYDRAAQHVAERRTWTLEQPDWWVDTSTVARRRALTQEQRATWLRRQSA